VIDDLGHVMLKVTSYVMLFAPIAVWAAIMATVSKNGLAVLWKLVVFMGGFYLSLMILWGILVVVGFIVIGPRYSHLLRLIREPLMIAFSTASSEAAYPKTLEGLNRFGASARISSFVLPLGYSFNLDGTMMYCTFASIFIAQTYKIEMSLGTQFAMLATLMITSKGVAGVPRASLVVIASTLSQFGIPEAGLLMIMGIDTFLDMGRSATNVIGNSLATAVVAVGFQPVRERVQKLANRLVYGKRATPYEVLSRFAENVAETYAGEEVLSRMAQVLADGTGAVRAEVWLRSGDFVRSAAVHPDGVPVEEPVPVREQEMPELPEADRVVPVRHQGELLGALAVTKRQGESLTPIEEKLLTDLALQAGLVLKNVGLTADLLLRLDDLRASRQRLVAAQDTERRRLERNLHDGAQQNLVAIKVKLGLAEMFAASDPQKAQALITEITADAGEALETLRDLARGIYPPLLADQGLAAALSAQARKALLPVQVEAEDIGRYSQDIEAAVYFCCLEAVQNVAKYAQATTVTIRLKRAGEDLQFTVSDDGQGFDSAITARGSGLQNMADRLAALGGDLDVSSKPGEGTTVTGVVPAAVLQPA